MFWRKPSNAAINALLAEHDLRLIELVPANPFARTLADGIISAMRIGVRGAFDQTLWVNKFNCSQRYVQLNVVVLGFIEAGVPPLLRSEGWRQVLNPFVLVENSDDLSRAERYFQKRYGGSWRLSKGRLFLADWGLYDRG